MEKDVWKWLFSKFSDITLYQLVCGVNIVTESPKDKLRIKGTRNLKNIKEQIPLYRGRLEGEINKSKYLSRVIQVLRSSIKDSEIFESLTALCDKETEDIWNEVYISNLEVVDVLVYLMIQTDSKQKEKGIDIYQRMLKENANKKDSVEADSNEELKQNAIDISENNINLFELHTEINNLKQEITRIKNNNSALKSDQIKLIEEKRNLLKQNKDLKKKLNQECSKSNNLTSKAHKLEREKQIYKTEIGNRDGIILELRKQIDKYQMVEIHLNKQLKNFNNRIKELEEEKNTLYKEEEQLDHDNSVRKITIIDRNMRNIPDGLDKVNSIAIELIAIELIIKDEFEQSRVSNILEHSDEIWGVEFRVPPNTRTSLRKKYGNKVIIFSDYNKLKEYCNIQYKKGKSF